MSVHLQIDYVSWHHETERPTVVVSVGSATVALLEPVRSGVYDVDSIDRMHKENDIAEETVLPYLRRLFSVDLDEGCSRCS